MKKRLVAGALAAGLALTGGTVVGAQGLETASDDGKHKVIRLYSRAMEGDTDVFLVGPPGSGGEGGEPQFVEGVGFLFTETLWAANKAGEPYGDPIGRSIVECRVVDLNDPDPETEGEPGEDATQVCEGYLQLPKGDLYLETSFSFSDFENGGVHGGVSSGSQHYEGADGGFTVNEVPIEGEDEDTAAVWEVRLEKDKR